MQTGKSFLRVVLVDSRPMRELLTAFLQNTGDIVAAGMGDAGSAALESLRTLQQTADPLLSPARLSISAGVSRPAIGARL